MVFPKWTSAPPAKKAVKSLGGVGLWILGVVVVVLALSLMRESDGPLLADEDGAGGDAVSQKAPYEGPQRGDSGGPQAAEGSGRQTAGEYSSTITEAPPTPPLPVGEPTEEVPLPASMHMHRDGAEPLASVKPSTPTNPATSVAGIESQAAAPGVEPATGPVSRYDGCQQQLCMQPQVEEIAPSGKTAIEALSPPGAEEGPESGGPREPPAGRGGRSGGLRELHDTDSAAAQATETPPNTTGTTGVSQADNDAGGVPDPADHSPSTAKPDQSDTDEGGIVEAGDSEPSEPENETT